MLGVMVKGSCRFGGMDNADRPIGPVHSVSGLPSIQKVAMKNQVEGCGHLMGDPLGAIQRELGCRSDVLMVVKRTLDGIS